MIEIQIRTACRLAATFGTLATDPRLEWDDDADEPARTVRAGLEDGSMSWTVFHNGTVSFCLFRPGGHQCLAASVKPDGDIRLLPIAPDEWGYNRLDATSLLLLAEAIKATGYPVAIGGETA